MRRRLAVYLASALMMAASVPVAGQNATPLAQGSLEAPLVWPQVDVSAADYTPLAIGQAWNSLPNEPKAYLTLMRVTLQPSGVLPGVLPWAIGPSYLFEDVGDDSAVVYVESGDPFVFFDARDLGHFDSGYVDGHVGEGGYHTPMLELQALGPGFFFSVNDGTSLTLVNPRPYPATVLVGVHGLSPLPAPENFSASAEAVRHSLAFELLGQGDVVGTGALVLARLSYLPGAADRGPSTNLPSISYVESGSIEYSLVSGSANLLTGPWKGERPGTNPPRIEPGTTVTLEAGEAVLEPGSGKSWEPFNGATVQIRNAGSETASVIALALLGPGNELVEYPVLPPTLAGS